MVIDLGFNVSNAIAERNTRHHLPFSRACGRYEPLQTNEDNEFDSSFFQAGVSHVFVNLGSDHPAIMEALAHGAIEGVNFPKVITCPHEVSRILEHWRQLQVLICIWRWWQCAWRMGSPD